MTTIDNIMALADNYATLTADPAAVTKARDALRTALTEALAAKPVREQLTSDQLMALTLCHEDKRVSVSRVQRILQISYKEAQELCQSIIDAGQCKGFEIAPNLHGIGSDK